MKRLFLILLVIVAVSTLFGGTASKKVIIDTIMAHKVKTRKREK